MTTTPERWARIGELFDAASGLQGGALDDYLRDACAGDADLESEIRSLLAVGADATSFLERPAIERPDTLRALHERADLVGYEIGPYLIESLLGTGGMGAVYRAHDPRLDRHVAIKALPEPVASDPDRIAKFRSEARAIAALSHPNVATIHGLEEAGGSVFLVLELVQGESLRETLTHGAMPVDRAAAIGMQIASALEAAHDRGVIHRDLKPGNVMLGPGGLVKVLDFGLARRLDDEVTDDAETPETPRPIEGTPGYMSPEQARGGAHDERTDIFALGCLLYECLAGRRAFGGGSIRARLDAVLHAPPDLTQLPEHTPPELRQLLASCLSTDPERRPRSMRSIRTTLERLTGRAPTSAGATPGAESNAERLPTQTSSFIGRHEELDQLHTLLDGERLITVTGAGGTGKTRVVLRAAESHPRTTPGTLIRFVALAPLRDPAHVESAVAQALGIREGSNGAREQIRAALADGPALLILDNCEHVRPACAALVHELLQSCPHLTVLATSREPLGIPSERVLPLRPLRLPDAETQDSATLQGIESVRLFLDRAAQVRPGLTITPTDAQQIAELCRRLDGVPLSIELAASRMRVLSPGQILDRLDNRFTLLRRTSGTPDETDTHATLWNTIRWSYELLCDEERALFAMLSVFVDGWSLDGAVAASELDEISALDLLTQLVEKSLVEMRYPQTLAGEPRFTMLESVREFAAQVLPEHTDPAIIRERAGRHFLSMTKTAFSELRTAEGPRWMERLQADHGNLLQSTESLPATEALRLATSIARFWESRGHLLVGQRAIENILSRADDSVPTDLLTRATGNAATFAMHRGHYEEAESLLDGAIDQVRDRGTPESLALILQYVGIMWYFRGDLAQARLPFEESLAISESIGDHRQSAIARGNLANILQEEGDLESACAMLEGCLGHFRAIGDARDIIIALANLGTTLHLMGRLEEAELRCQESLELSRQLNDQQCAAHALSHLSVFALLREDTNAARGMIVECLILLERLGDHRQGAYALEAAARLARLRGAHELALRLSGAADGIRDEIGMERAEHIEALHAETVRLASDALSDAQQRIALQQGRALSYEAAARVAVEWLDPNATFATTSASSIRGPASR